ncbi:uncharacterized protein LOC111054383 [Nilaparvata lugens]|uniref:uncharacterized protein LOC111054383 n=1 Tax=Nilaparvata lugens TaxID=108931 RepID=UPI00193E01B3|nr:uncharacterized protein LOC111054383 [Nilaparvata lugens]
MMASRRRYNATPICRCRVLYLGSAVPQVSKDGLQGIQDPLRDLYPDQGAIGARGIDSWLSVWSNGLLLENIDENHKKITRFFPIDTLHYCAAVRFVLIPEKGSSASLPRFLPLDSPFARAPDPNHPPLFAAILRRTTGIKVLECHAFICKREMAANALVRCCFHAYADSSYAKHLESGGTTTPGAEIYDTIDHLNRTSRSMGKFEGQRRMASLPQSVFTDRPRMGTLSYRKDFTSSADDISIYNGNPSDNYRTWNRSTRDLSSVDNIYGELDDNTMRSMRSNRPRQVTNSPHILPPNPNLFEMKSSPADKQDRKKTKPLPPPRS